MRGARLFLSYRWSYDDDDVGFWVEEFASWLFNRGYDIVYDRDPRHIDKDFTSNDLLAGLLAFYPFVVVTVAYRVS
jgi:hypothetical protein